MRARVPACLDDGDAEVREVARRVRPSGGAAARWEGSVLVHMRKRRRVRGPAAGRESTGRGGGRESEMSEGAAAATAARGRGRGDGRDGLPAAQRAGGPTWGARSTPRPSAAQRRARGRRADGARAWGTSSRCGFPHVREASSSSTRGGASRRRRGVHRRGGARLAGGAARARAVVARGAARGAAPLTIVEAGAAGRRAAGRGRRRAPASVRRRRRNRGTGAGAAAEGLRRVPEDLQPADGSQARRSRGARVPHVLPPRVREPCSGRCPICRRQFGDVAAGALARVRRRPPSSPAARRRRPMPPPRLVLLPTDVAPWSCAALGRGWRAVRGWLRGGALPVGAFPGTTASTSRARACGPSRARSRTRSRRGG